MSSAGVVSPDPNAAETITEAISRAHELVAEIERLQAVIFVMREARVDYDAALRNREHGGVAADRFIRAVTAELDSAAGEEQR